jgi:hypothetical protein
VFSKLFKCSYDTISHTNYVYRFRFLFFIDCFVGLRSYLPRRSKARGHHSQVPLRRHRRKPHSSTPGNTRSVLLVVKMNLMYRQVNLFQTGCFIPKDSEM